MQYAIERLRKEREQIVNLLRAGHQEKLKDLQSLDKALGWLNLLQEHNVDQANKYDFEALPYIEGRGGFTYYRLMVDDETDDTADWYEYVKEDGSGYQLCLGDYILIRKPYN